MENAFILLKRGKNAEQCSAKICDDSVGDVIFDGVLHVDLQAAVPLDVGKSSNSAAACLLSSSSQRLAGIIAAP